MLTVRAVEPIYTNNEITGWKLQDDSGQTMSVSCEKIIQVIKSNSANITNLAIASNGELMLKQENVEIIENMKNFTTNNIVHIEENSTDKSDKDRMLELVDILNKAREVYEQGDSEIMSNYEYDKYYDELLALERKLGYAFDNSPTQNVGYEVDGKLPKEKHEFPMLSADKTKDVDSLPAWLNGKEGVLSWKMDGLTVVLIYEGGRLIKAITRGNGVIGELVTENAKTFVNVPKHIAYEGKLVVRGEAVLTYSAFDKLNKPNSNPRNLCSGSVRQQDSSVTAKRGVSWYAFKLVYSDKASYNNNYNNQLDWLKMLGFETVEHVVVNPSNVIEIEKQFESRVEGFDIPVDGLVLTYRDTDYGKTLGRTAKFYKDLIAIKWEDEYAETELLDIEWQVGRSGVITPVAVFKPITICGTTVERASLHNISILIDKLGQYPYVGQKIRVFKANMIIPQILSSEKLEIQQ